MFKFTKSLFNTCYTGFQIFCSSVKKTVQQEIQQSRNLAEMRYNTKHNTAQNEDTADLDKKLNISLNEAMRILNVNKLSKDDALRRFEFLFEANEKVKGGTFYLQSKIYRAKERLQHEFEKEGADRSNCN